VNDVIDTLEKAATKKDGKAENKEVVRGMIECYVG
jgi:hypothetical protein